MVDAVKIVAGKDVTSTMISEAIQLDRLSYNDVFQLQLDTCVDYYNSNCDIYIMSIDLESDRVIGYINFSPVKEPVFVELKSGSVIDTVITGDDVLPYEDARVYFGYFSSIVVHPEHRQRGIATKMLLYWSDFVAQLAAKRRIYFKEIVADAVSDVGAYLLSELGFTLCRSSTHKSRIMTLNLFSREISQTKYNSGLLTEYTSLPERRNK